MKRFFLITLLLFFTFSISAQINYEPGYFIDNGGKYTSCLIRNVDWKSNPTSFEFKLTENTNPKRASIETIKEFTITDEVRYERHTVKINRSSDDTNNLENDRGIVFKEEELFLKVLVKGEAMLYYYEDKNLRRFFFSTPDAPMVQLVYKRYRKSAIEIGENTQFKQQLFNHLKCEDISRNYTNNTRYKQEVLVHFFKKYNSCKNVDVTIYGEEKGKFIFHMSLRPGVQSSSLSISNNFSPFKDVNFDTKSGLRFGLEMETTLPFNENKWALLVEPAFQSYKTEKETIQAGFSNTTLAHVDYKSIEIALGVRHYFFLSESSKLFINGALVFDKALDSYISFENASQDLTINTNESLSIGIGYKFENKLSLELRHVSKRSILIEYASWRTDFSDNFSVIFGYTIF